MKTQLHSSCIPVEGFFRTAVYDLQFGNFYFTSTQFWENCSNGEAGIEMKSLPFASEVFMSNPEKHILPMANPEFDYPSHITNAIIEIDHSSDFDKLSSLLEEIYCYNLQIVVINPGLTESYISNMVTVIHRSIFKHCELVINYEAYVQVKDLLKRTAFPELSFLCVYSSPENELRYASRDYSSTLFCQDPFSYIAGNSIKSMDLFQINPVLYAESLKFNNYYNRKVFVDKEGWIKNGPLVNESYGNIYAKNAWQDLLKNKAFKKLWNVKKDSISVCEVCEFRYMCTDARVPQRHKNGGKWYHTTECNYNPYIAKWRDEPGYISLGHCGVVVEREGVSIDEDVLIGTLQNIYSAQQQHG